MERMKDFKAEVDRLVGEYIEELEEENKKLKEEISSLRIELEQEKGKTGKKGTPATPYI